MYSFYKTGYQHGLESNPALSYNAEYNQGYVDAQRDINRVLHTMAQVGYAMMTEADQKIADYILD